MNNISTEVEAKEVVSTKKVLINAVPRQACDFTVQELACLKKGYRSLGPALKDYSCDIGG
jgi:hypothetical protein